MASNGTPPAATTTTSPITGTNTAPQPYKYSGATQSADPKPARHGPSKAHEFLDIIVKLIATASLVGILVVLAMLLKEMKSASGSLDDLQISLSNMAPQLSSLATYMSPPFAVRIAQNGATLPVAVQNGGFGAFRTEMVNS